MSISEIKDFKICSYSQTAIAMLALSENEHALYSQTIPTTLLDSGATRHFSGVKSDFRALKH